MTSFDEREKAAENKYTHDAEVDFKINARAHKLLGLWAADKMGMDDAKANAYAMEIVDVDFEAAGEEDVLQRVISDLADAGLSIDIDDIGDALVKCQNVAREQIYKIGTI